VTDKKRESKGRAVFSVERPGVKDRALFCHDPQDGEAQYLEDLSTGYWSSFVLFTAVEAELFGLTGTGGRDVEEISRCLGFEDGATGRFLDALCALGLLTRDGRRYSNTKVSSEYLVPGKERYQGEGILWRKELLRSWSGLAESLKAGGRVMAVSGGQEDDRSERTERYLRAMDSAASSKVGEIAAILAGLSPEGWMLDVGTGSGGVAMGLLRVFPRLRATLMDLPEILDHTRRFVAEQGLEGRIEYCPANILEPWPGEKGRYSLVVLSNIIHAYSEKELPHVLGEAASALANDGLLLIHDFFPGHYPEKAALFDLNMLINTYNGRVFPNALVEEELMKLGFFSSGLIPLAGDTSLVAASRERTGLDALVRDQRTSLARRVKALGFRNVVPVPARSVSLPDWPELRCRFGCEHYGSPGCPPHGPTPAKTRRLLKQYSHALLLEGTPPTKDFQLMVLGAEREAFVSGFHKAFALWAGPCSICPTCAPDGACRDRKRSRPSMEGAGIDVFETVRRAGLAVAPLAEKDLFVKYFGLLVVE